MEQNETLLGPDDAFISLTPGVSHISTGNVRHRRLFFVLHIPTGTWKQEVTWGPNSSSVKLLCIQAPHFFICEIVMIRPAC